MKEGRLGMTRMFVCLFAAALLLQGCGEKCGEDEPAAAVKVKVDTVMRREISTPVRTSGVLVSSAEMKLSFKTGGFISRIFAEEGDEVMNGDILARLDLSEMKALLQQSESAWEKARRDLQRVENLYSDSVATLEQLQNARTALEVASSDLRRARFNMKHSRIKAPAGGRILKRLAQENELVSSGMPVFLFGSQREGWKVRVGVTDRDLVSIEPGDSASVTLDAWRGIEFPGRVTRISRYAGPRTGTYEVELTLNAGRDRFASGFTAKVLIFPSRRVSAFLFPVSSLVEAEGDRGSVYLLEKDRNMVKRIEVGIISFSGDMVAGRADIEEPAIVVTEGAPYLTDGNRVEVVE